MFKSYLKKLFIFSLFFICQKINAQKPNIVLIMADDLGYECIGVNGNIEYDTPNLDRLASAGLNFANCYSQPLCTPSRIKIMTGKYNFRNYEYFDYLNPSERTFGNLLKESGYATCVAGKWQLNGLRHNNPDNQDVNRPNNFGFDEYCLWQLDRKRSKKDERYADPLIIQNGSYLTRNKEDYGPDVFAEYLMDFIDRKSNQPFFIYYPMVLVHNPFVPTPDSPEWNDAARRYEEDTTYLADMVAYTDKIVGQIEAKLKEVGVWENTVFIFTADNGTKTSVVSTTQFGNIKGGKGTTLNTGNHVPMILTWPKEINMGRVVDAIIDFADVFPTFADIAGVDSSSYVSDGISFLDLIMGKENRPDKKEIFIHYTPRTPITIREEKAEHNRWVMNDNYKLYRDGRFYNTLKDPDENFVDATLSIKELKLKNRFKGILLAKEKEFPFEWNNLEYKPLK